MYVAWKLDVINGTLLIKYIQVKYKTNKIAKLNKHIALNKRETNFMATDHILQITISNKFKD